MAHTSAPVEPTAPPSRDALDSKTCCICLGFSPKYRCPKCHERYCSVKCYAKHKQVHIVPPAADKDVNSVESVNKNSDEATCGSAAGRSFSEDPKMLLSDKQKGKLSSSSYIKDMLESERLRKHIESVDTSGDRGAALKRLRTNNKEFNEFVTKMVDLVEHEEAK